MALADIARFKNNEPISLRDISIRQGISLVYLEQLFLKLKKNEIVKSINKEEKKLLPVLNSEGKVKHIINLLEFNL